MKDRLLQGSEAGHSQGCTLPRLFSFPRNGCMPLSAGTKANLISQFKAGQVISFHGRDFAPSEAATRYELWTASNTSYAITWEVMYEPYFIVDRLQMGKIPYDVRFRSGAHNKQEQVGLVGSHLAALQLGLGG